MLGMVRRRDKKMPNDIHFEKELVIAECRRIIDLLQDGNLHRGHNWDPVTPHLSELRRKMRELRRDTIRLDKLLYSQTRR
jgi:zona occludens toxin (predicted ATPase)